jgi:hypothetical protein
MMAFRHFLEDGTTNLVVIVSFLIFSISLIPAILWFGVDRSEAPKSDQ